jgi:hypothetical protein
MKVRSPFACSIVMETRTIPFLSNSRRTILPVTCRGWQSLCSTKPDTPTGLLPENRVFGSTAEAGCAALNETASKTTVENFRMLLSSSGHIRSTMTRPFGRLASFAFVLKITKCGRSKVGYSKPASVASRRNHWATLPGGRKFRRFDSGAARPHPTTSRPPRTLASRPSMHYHSIRTTQWGPINSSDLHLDADE